MNSAIIGDPRTAPDALFALDGRMQENELRQALKALAKLGSPEVVLVQATRAVRLEAPGWKKRLARFCLMLEDVFATPPGVIIVTDEPHTAYRLKEELWEQNQKRDSASRWHTPHEFKIFGIPSTVGGAGLFAAGVQEAQHPVPREFNVHIVDADAAKAANKLVRIASAAPGVRKPLDRSLKQPRFSLAWQRSPAAFGTCRSIWLDSMYRAEHGLHSTGPGIWGPFMSSSKASAWEESDPLLWIVSSAARSYSATITRLRLLPTS